MFLHSDDMSKINHMKEHLVHEYGLNILYISQADRSFERALSKCLFDNEDEIDSISSVLYKEKDW
jgi:hypothetical protein